MAWLIYLAHRALSLVSFSMGIGRVDAGILSLLLQAQLVHLPRLISMLCVFGQQRSARHQGKHRRTSLGEAVSRSDSPTPEVRIAIE